MRSAVATERSTERGVAAQRFAQARGAVKNKIQAAPVLRTDAWRRSVGQPLLRDSPALGSQTFTRDADPRLFKQGGAAGQQPAARARCRMVAQDIERGAAPREPIASAIPVREGQREAQAPAQGDVHVRRGQRGARVSRHSGKPSPRMRARLRARQARSLGRMCGSSVSRKLELSARDAKSCQPCGQSPGSLSSATTGGASRARMSCQDGRSGQWRRSRSPATAASRRQGAAASSSTRSSRTHRSAASGRRWSMTGKESAQAADRWKKSKAAGLRPSGAALAEERLQCAPDRMVMCFRVRRRLGRRHGAEQVLRPRRGAKEEQQPGTLQVRQLWQLCQQALLLLQALPRSRGNVLRGADGRAEGNKPTLGQRFVATPRLRAEL